MFNLATIFRGVIVTPRVFVKKLWFYHYQDFNLIFEQSDVLHYFYVSTKSQKFISRALIVFIITTLSLVITLTIYSGITAWRIQALEASKLVIEQKRAAALAALYALSNTNSQDKLSHLENKSQEDLIKLAKNYRDQHEEMQMLIEFSSQELKLASLALKEGLIASGVPSSKLQKVMTDPLKYKYGVGGDSNEVTLDRKNSLTSKLALNSYRNNVVQLEKLKQVYHFLPSKAPVSKAVISSKFGVRVHPITQKLTRHEGLDYAPTFDLNAKAVLPGVVEKVEYSALGYGNMVSLLHANNIRTTYAHLDNINVAVDQKVKLGDVLGQVGNTGFSTGKHLHYEISIDKIKVNPLIITAMAKNVQ
jgi:murein DD-endopeptidase MepM/ murein hydrolase activator NlpD